METSVLKVVGQVAGIGGIALGVLLLIFRDVIRRNIFPTLNREQAYNLIRLIIILTFTIAALGLGAWVFTNTNSAGNPVTYLFFGGESDNASSYQQNEEIASSRSVTRLEGDKPRSVPSNKPLQNIQKTKLQNNIGTWNDAGLNVGLISVQSSSTKEDEEK